MLYAVVAALNHNKITNHPEKTSKLKPFINNYNWEDIEFPSHSKDWKKIEENNKAIALNTLFVPYNTKQIRAARISKYNNERDNQVNFLMITNNDKDWHYLTVKSISKLLRRNTSNHDEDFYCLNCFHPYTTKNRLEKHEKICRDHDFCYVKMPDENNKILKYIPGEKSLKVSIHYLCSLRMFTSKNKYMPK